MRRIVLALALVVALAPTARAVPLEAQEPPGADGVAAPPTDDPLPPLALFAAHEALALRIEADFRQLRDDRADENEERPGTVTLTQTGQTLPVDVRTRGRFRLQSNTCRFPPLRLDFPKGALEGTVLDGQDKLKLVTHCRDRDDFEQNVIKELLAYRIYNLVTDRSFRVRLARITYVDTAGEEDTVERYGFLIEHDDALAARLGGEALETQPIHPSQVRGELVAPLGLFQYLVGNTDFSLYAGHNVVFVRTADALVPVPYDFDWSGLVNASYARPDPSLGTRSVRDRVYRELCRPDVDYAALFARFEALRPDVEALVRGQEGLAPREVDEVLDYLKAFYDTLASERRRDREIVKACRSA